MAFVFPNNYYGTWNPAFLEMGEPLTADEKQRMNSLFFFSCVCGFCFI